MDGLPPPALPCAVFVVSALAVAGVVHVVWLRNPCSRRFATPIDRGASWRGRRIFGDNKTWSGLMAMPLAAAMVFALVAQFREYLPARLAAGIWSRSASELALVGLACGLAFMLAELPNSFLKRQLGIGPGAVAQRMVLRVLFLFIDRIDSTLGVLVVLSVLLPVHGMTWVWALLLGICLHWIFSYWLFLLRLKGRPS